MTARPVPLTAEPSIMYAVMTAHPLDSDDLLPPPSPELLRHYGTSEATLQRLDTRRHQLLLMRTCTVDDAAFVQRDVRIEALRLAEQHDGVVVDLAIPRAVEERSEAVSLAHATQWYVTDYSGLDDGRLRTIGLTSFGIPEILLEGVDRHGHAMHGAVLAGLVHRLIAEWPANDPVGEATVTLRDIAYGLGDSAAAETPADRAIGIRIDYVPEQLVVRLLQDPATTLFAP